MSLHNLKEALDFAIAREEEAAKLYANLMNMTDNPRAKEVFRELEQVELKHKKSLENFDLDEYQNRSQELTLDLQTTDLYQPVDKTTPNMNFQEALALAAQREARAVKLYQNLANRFSTHPPLEELFSTLADEEARHKHTIDVLYDDTILKDN